MATLSFVLLIIILFVAVAATDEYSSSSSFVYAGCSQPKYPPNSPYEYSVESVLSSVANSASLSSFSNFTSPLPPPLFALFQCRGDLPLPDCSSCVHSALSRLPSLCPSALSAAIQLRSCYLRYGNDSFLSRPDTSLLYKTCSSSDSSSSSSSSSSDFIASRDSAFSALTAASTPYRLGASAGLRAEAQCVGDLTAGDCSNCVEAAAAQVKASCGGAASGEAYLGKCYIRYYNSDGAGRPYAYANGGRSEGADHDDETGKTLAIIIGLMAGVALIIVFLSFIKRNGSGKY